jgi:ABC-type transport system involved in cytochrome bd biosynthesis fused ATPase/permease subunit
LQGAPAEQLSAIDPLPFTGPLAQIEHMEKNASEGGQAQRVAAARRLVREAELLVFDDLSSALDVETEQTLWERLFATRNRTYLVVSHRQTVLLNGENRLRRQSLWRSNARGML